MTRLSEADFDAGLALVRDCDGAADLPDYRTRVLGVADLMDTNAVAYNEADVVSGVVTAEVRPDWMYEERWRRAFGRFSDQHPIIAHISATGDLTPTAISDLVSEAEFHVTDLYREFFRPLGIEDQIAFGLPSSPRMVLGVSVNRPYRGFSEEERALLALLAPHLGNAYLAARARTVVSAGAESPSSGEHLIVLDEDGMVTATVGAPANVLGTVGSSLMLGEPFPRELLGQDDNPGQEGEWPQAGSAIRLEVDGAAVEVRSFEGGYPGAARIFELREDREALDPQRAADLKITPREAEVANLLARGLSDQLIAGRLTISPHTVKRHTEHLYAKLGVGSRWEALARLLSPESAELP